MIADEVGDLARVRGVGLLELSPQQMSLEQRYMQLTRDATDYTTAGPAPSPGTDPELRTAVMTVTTALRAAPAAGSHRDDFVNVLRAELCKLRTVRSTYAAVLAALAPRDSS
jgi:hypothetical protein